MLKTAESVFEKVMLLLVHRMCSTALHYSKCRRNKFSDQSLEKAVIVLKYLCGKEKICQTLLWFIRGVSKDLFLFSSYIFYLSLPMFSVSVLGFGPWVFPLHAWLCHRIFISLHTGRGSPLLLGVWHHFLLDSSIYQPSPGTSTELRLQGKIVHSLMDTNAPVLIRNVSQCLTASVSHSLGRKKKTLSLA